MCPRIGGSRNRASSRRAHPKSQMRTSSDRPPCAASGFDNEIDLDAGENLGEAWSPQLLHQSQLQKNVWQALLRGNRSGGLRTSE